MVQVGAVKVGALVQNFGGFPETGRSSRACIDLARHAERVGFDSVWVTDHIVLPEVRDARYPHNDEGTFPYTWDQDIHDPMVLLGALAQATERVEIGVAVLVIPYRHPLTTAKMLATVDQLAQGRLVLGAGVGWLRDEFVALGLDDEVYAHRGSVTDEFLDVLRAAWTAPGAIARDGRFVSFGPVGTYPRPARVPHPPIWIGGKGPRALRRAVTRGDGYFAISSDPEQLAAEVAQLRGVAADRGRDPDTVTIALTDGIVVTDRAIDGARAPLHGTPEQISAGLDEFARAGLEHLVAGVRLAGDPTYAGAIAALDALAPVLDERRGSSPPKGTT